jgi:ATP-binding cassette subfamily B protein
MAEARPARPMGPMRGPGGPGARGMRGPRPKIKNPGKLFMRVMKYVFKDYAIPYIIVIACIFVGVFASIQGTLFTKTLIDEYITPFLLRAKKPHINILKTTF